MTTKARLITWVGITPFFGFALLFLVLPTAYLFVGALQDSDGHLTLANLAGLAQPTVVAAFKVSLEISAASAGLGAIFGFFVAHAIVFGHLPRWLRPLVTTFCGVASNFAGIPLAFAFLATLGRTGLLTALLRDYAHLDIYANGFNLLSFGGLTLTYLYFQVPLMVLILTPALDGLKSEWREASQTLGATSFQHWRYIALPVLWPSILGAALLLFANSFGAVATAFALTGSSLNIVTILLFAQIRGDVMHNENLGYALALGMIAITGLSNVAFLMLRARGERWLR